MKNLCPNCNTELILKHTKIGIALVCPHCKGIAISSTVAFSINRRLFTQIWDLCAGGLGHSGKNCPSCSRQMRQFPLRHDNPENSILVDVCLSSQLFWLDQGELSKSQTYDSDYTITLDSDDIRMLREYSNNCFSETNMAPSGGKNDNNIRSVLYGISGALAGFIVYIIFKEILSIYFYAAIGFILGFLDSIVDAVIENNFSNIAGKTLLGLVLVPLFSLMYGSIDFFEIRGIIENVLIGFSSGLTYSFGKRLIGSLFVRTTIHN